ncbi:purine-cytosine transporter [Cellulosimicrobium funkei]|nr:purine-cytosine transporter [Cellulosimicrobium funkei]
MMLIWLAANLVVTTLLTGTLFVPGVSFTTALLAIVGGTLLGAMVLVAIGAIGTRTGLPTMALTRGAFGTRGSLLPVAVNVIVLMGWSWVQAMLAGLAVNYLVTSATGFSSPALFAVLCQLAVVGLAIFGHEGIARVEPWLALLILVIMGWMFAQAFTGFSPVEYAAIPVDRSAGYTPAIAFDVVFATAISWTVLSADFNRLARSTRAGVIGSGLGYSLSTIMSMTLGLTAFCYVLLTGADALPFDPVTIVEPFGWPLAIVIFLSVMATNTMVVYGMVTSVVNARPGRRLRFLPTALVLGAISVAGATWFGLLEQFTSFLTLVGAFFVPVFAIMIADYYVVRRGAYTRDLLRADGGRYWYRSGVNLLAVVVWLAGALVSWTLTAVWPSPVGATVPVFVLSFLLYTVASVAMGRRSEAAADRPVHLAEGAA